MSKKLDKKRARREAELRKQEEARRHARRRNLTTIATAVVVVALIVILVVAQRGNQKTDRTLQDASYRNIPSGLPGLMTGDPPWPANDGASLKPRLNQLGFPTGATESLAFHIHQHLDIFVHGQRVPVPAEVGIDAKGRFLTVLHTHDTTGVIHVESPIQKTYGLGQFFAVWGLRLTKDCIGGLCDHGSDQLTAYVNGKQVSDPRYIPLKEHEEIVLAYGTKDELPKPIPKSYNFPPGE